jgi:hypothetical protein
MYQHLAHNTDENGVPLGEDVWQTNTTDMEALLVTGVQYLLKENDKLKNTLSLLEQRLAALETKK